MRFSVQFPETFAGIIVIKYLCFVESGIYSGRGSARKTIHVNYEIVVVARLSA
jgi:hypothetical protein